MIRNKKRILLLPLVLILVFVMSFPAGAAEWPDTVVDGHLHYLDFLQQSDGFFKLTR